MNRTHLLVAALAFAVLAAPPTARAQDFLGKPLKKWRTDLDNQDAKVRRGAAFALGKFPNDTSLIMPLLLKRIKDDSDAGVREAAATALGDLMQPLGKIDNTDRTDYWQKAEPVLRQRLESETDARSLRGTLYAIGSFGPPSASLVDKVLTQLKAEEPSVRQNAAWALGRMGERAARAVDPLVERLGDKEALVRRDAATALGDIGLPTAKDAVRPLLSMVETEQDDVVRRTVLDKLINLVGPDNKNAARSLYMLLENEDPDTRHLAAFVLAKIGGEEAKPALKVLREALNDEEPEVQSLAAASLANLGPLAVPAVRDLGKVLRTATNNDVRRNCAVALTHLGPDGKDAIPDLVFVLKSDAPIEIRQYTAEALARMQYPANADALPDVLTVLAKTADDPQAGDMRQRCIWCFFSVEELKPDAVKTFTNILDERGEPSLMVRYDAARALALILGEMAPDKAATVLLDMLRNDKLLIYNRTDANVSGGGGEASPGASSVKANTGGDARYLAAQALGRMGKKASGNPEIVEELRKAAKGAKDERLRQESKDALLRLRVE